MADIKGYVNPRSLGNNEPNDNDGRIVRTSAYVFCIGSHHAPCTGRSCTIHERHNPDGTDRPGVARADSSS